MSADETDLALVSADSMIQELMDRFDHAAFIGMAVRDLPGHGESAIRIRRSWRGSPHVCLGLLADLSDVVLEDMRESSEDIDDPIP